MPCTVLYVTVNVSKQSQATRRCQGKMAMMVLKELRQAAEQVEVQQLEVNRL